MEYAEEPEDRSGPNGRLGLVLPCVKGIAGVRQIDWERSVRRVPPLKVVPTSQK